MDYGEYLVTVDRGHLAMWCAECLADIPLDVDWYDVPDERSIIFAMGLHHCATRPTTLSWAEYVASADAPKNETATPDGPYRSP